MPINTPTGYLDITNATLRGSKIVTTGYVGIANANPVNHLSVGSNLHINDTHSNVLQISGNVNAAGVVLGGISIAPTFDLEIVTNTGNTTPYTVEFNNTATAFVTTANATIGGTLTASKLVGDGSGISAIQSSNVTDFVSNVSRIAALETDLGDNSSRITTVSTDLSDNSSRITSLESDNITISGEKTFTDVVIFESNVHMNGGNVLVANTINMTVYDPIIELGSNNLNTGDVGIVMTRHWGNSNVAFVYDESADILQMGYTLNGANDSLIELDSNALDVNVQGALTVGSNVQCTNLHASNLTMNLVTMTGAHTFEQVVNNGRVLNSNVLIISNVTPSTSSATGALTLTAGGLGVAGNVHIGSKLSVTEESTLANLAVTGETTLSNLSVTGESTLANLSVTGETVEVANLAVTSGSLELTQVANVFQVKSSSNVVTEYARSKKLIKYPRVAMTAATSGGYTASASSQYDPSYGAYRAFNGVSTSSDAAATDSWQPGGTVRYSAADGTWTGGTGSTHTMTLTTGTTIYGSWVQLQMPSKIKLVYMNFSPMYTPSGTYDNLGIHRSPRDGYILGSNDGTNWTPLKNWSGLTFDYWNRYEAYFGKIDVNDTSYYKYFRLVWTRTVGGTYGEYASAQEIEYHGIPEYDPDAHGTDVIARSVPNVPNMDWLEVYYDGQDYTSMPSSVTDKSGNNVTGTPTNGVTFDSTWKAFSFASSNEITAPITLSGGDYVHSFAGWVKFNSKSADDYIFHIGSGTANQSIGFHSRPSGNEFRYFFWGNDLDVPFNYQPNQWYHLCGTYSGGGTSLDTVKLYVNGLQLPGDSDNNLGSTLNIPTSTTLTVGGGPSGSQLLNGSVANFRLFNRALTADEVWQLYAYQKDYFQVSPDALTFKGGRLGIGTEEPKAVLDVSGIIHANGGQSWPVPTAVFSNVTPSNTGSSWYSRNIGTHYVHYNTIYKSDSSGTIGSPALNTDNITLHRTGMYEIYTESCLQLQGSTASHLALRIHNKNVGGSLIYLSANGQRAFQSDYRTSETAIRTHAILVTEAPVDIAYYLQPSANRTDRFMERGYGNSAPIHIVYVKYLG